MVLESDAKIGYPPKNQFIPDNIIPSVIKAPENSKEIPILLERQGSKVWYKPDTRFTQPQVALTCKMVNGLYRTDPKNIICLNLWNTYMKFFMRSSIDMFNTALGSWANMYFPDYFGFKILAYNNHHRQLAEHMFKKIPLMEPSEAFFDLNKPALLKTLAVFDK